MSSTPVVPAPIHPSWWSRAATWVVNEAKVVKNTIVKIAGFTPEIQAEIDKIAPTAEALSNLVVPGSGAFEAHLLDVWGVAASAVNDAGAAAGANGISITLDQNLVNDIKSFIPSVKAKMSAKASSAPAAVVPAS